MDGFILHLRRQSKDAGQAQAKAPDTLLLTHLSQ